jgi:hypothetical protein
MVSRQGTLTLSRHAPGLLNLAALLVVTIGVAVALTAYLVRRDPAPPVPPPAPAPYRVLFQQGSQLQSIGPQGQSQELGIGVPSATATGLNLWPGDRGIVVASSAPDSSSLYLIRGPGQPAETLPFPPPSYGPGPWRVAAATWSDASHVVVLLANAHASGGGIVAKYAVDRSPAQAVAWLHLPRHDALAALSPDGLQVARVDSLPRTQGFAPQILIRLLQIAGTGDSVVLQYLGAQPPQAIAWSPDGHALAIQVPNQGLAIQTASGQRIRFVPDAAGLSAFSPRGATQLAYITWSSRAWQVNVLRLQRNTSTVFTPPTAAAPTGLAWTPDARALIYVAGNSVWQVDPSTGTSTKLAGAVHGKLIGVFPASAPFAR